MTNKEKFERFIKSEIFFLEDFDEAYPPKYDGDLRRWIHRNLSSYGLELCQQEGRYYAGIGESRQSWDEIAAAMDIKHGSGGNGSFTDNIIAYMDLVLENEKPKPITVEVSYDLESITPGDVIIYKTYDGDIRSSRYKPGIEPIGEVRRNYIEYFKAKPHMIIKNVRALLVKP